MFWLFMIVCGAALSFCIFKMVEALGKKQCVECAEDIDKAAKRCKHCGAIQPAN